MNESTAVSQKERLIFETYSPARALAAMVIPTVVSQIIFVLYNLADTWFVGLTNNADMVAAVSLCLPVYTLLSAVSNLFGIGGASVIARALGCQETARAARTFSVAFWSALLVGALYAGIMLFFGQPLLMRIGGDSHDIGYAVSYSLWAIVIGGIPTILQACLGHLIRSAGFSTQASFGMVLGALLNIALDPLFMFVILPSGQEIVGAALATTLSNCASLAYFLFFIFRHKGSVFSLSPKLLARSGQAEKEVFICGLPGFCMVAMAMFSNCILNAQISALGSAAVAGLGIVRKIDQLAYAVNQGITQGMLPLAAYSYSAGQEKRMWSIVGFATLISEAFSLLCTGTSLLFPAQLVEIFIKDPATVQFGARFLRILCLAIPIYTLTFVVIAVFQAAGKGAEAFVLSILHKGTLDIVFMFLLLRTGSLVNLLWAAPLSETIALLAAGMLLFRFRHQRQRTCARV